MSVNEITLPSGNTRWRASVYDKTTKKAKTKNFNSHAEALAWERTEYASITGGVVSSSNPEASHEQEQLRRTNFIAGSESKMLTPDTIAPAGHRIMARSGTTLGIFLDSWILESETENTRKLRQNLRDNIEPLSDVLLINLDSDQIIHWINGLRRGSSVSGRKLAESTIKTQTRMLKSALNVAVARNMLPKELHPMMGMKSRRSHGRAISPSEIPTDEDVIAFRTAMGDLDNLRFKRNADLEVMVSVAASSGLRISEIAGLRSSSIDKAGGRVMVVEQATGTKPWKWGPTKGSLTREVPLPDSIIDLCLTFAKEQKRGPRDPLFQTTNGAMWSASHANQARRRRSVSFPWHSLRHYYASTLIHNGVDVPTVSSLLGHSSTQITLEVYTHILPGAMTRARSVITAAVSTNGLI